MEWGGLWVTAHLLFGNTSNVARLPRLDETAFTAWVGYCFFFFFQPKYIKAIYCNSRRQTSLLVFLPQTLYFSMLQMSLSDACVHLFLSLWRSSSSLLWQSVWSCGRSETIWSRLMDNLKNSACEISVETMFVFRGWASESRSHKGTCSLPAAL